MDNLRAHETPNIMKILTYAKIKTLFIPSYTSEFNAIEVYWSHLKKKVKNSPCIRSKIAQ